MVLQWLTLSHYLSIGISRLFRPGKGVLLPARYEPLSSVRLNGRLEAAGVSHRTTAIGAEAAVSIASGERSAYTALPAKSL